MRATKKTVQLDDDFGDMCISALRYALGRRTYIVRMTSDYLIARLNENCFSERILGIMRRDLSRYFEDRKNGLVGDDVFDLEDWEKLWNVLNEKWEKEEWNNGLS